MSDQALCQCGCGKPAPIAKRTDRATSRVKGQPMRFISGHNNRGNRVPNRALHLGSTTIIFLDRKGGDEVLCYLDRADYPLVKGYRWYVYQQRKNGTCRVVAHDIKMHQLLMPLSDGRTTDHKDRNPLNNRRSNLRPATQSQQQVNKVFPNTTGYIGVWRSASRIRPYRAALEVDGKQIYLGVFSSPVQAAQVRDEAAKQYYGEFAVTNESLGLLPTPPAVAT
jgi:hypothetical protein